MAVIHGFELIREETIEELNTLARLYRHDKSGAELLSLTNDDENKVFGVTFRTPPPDSTGVAHIMEHSVLGGSRKYPVKEPFVELIKGSLNTFLNAFTSADWTAYPVASTNLQDFYNLVDVYLDAVFYPLITPYHLDQEGWHFELVNQTAPLTYKGVVFNEMKGAYSSPDDVFGRYNQQSLFFNHVYGLDSGGAPHDIPNLTYEGFKQFHRTYYHPANSRIFFYGDDDEKERLRILDEYLSGFDYHQVESTIPLAPRYDQPRYFTHTYSVDGDSPDSSKSRLQVNWLLPENSDPSLTMALSILSFALVSTPASPLRKALIDSGMGDDLTGGGLSGSLRELTFGVGLKGIVPTNADKVENLILNTLSELADSGFEQDMIEAAVNSIEFQLRENNTGRFPRGLSLLMAALGTWNYGGDPLAMIAYEAPLHAVKERLEQNPDYLQDLIRKYFLQNPHRTTVRLDPDPKLGEKLDQEEKERLAKAKAGMDQAELKAIIDNAKELKRRQETPDNPEALAAIPTLTLADLDMENKIVPIELERLQGSEVLFHDLFTNGIVYLDMGFDLHALKEDLLPFVNLFGSSLTKMGTEDLDYVKLSQRINQKTGGVWHSTLMSATSDGRNATAWFLLRGKATMEHAQDLLDIFQDILLTVKLDDQTRFRQIALEAKAGKEAGLIQMGHVVVGNRLAAQFNEADWAAERMGGIDYLRFLNNLIRDIETDWPAVHKILVEVHQALVNRQRMLLNVTLDGENYELIKPRLEGLVSTLPETNGLISSWSPSFQTCDEGLTIPARVNYVGKGANLYELGYDLDGSIEVITKFLRTTWLWEKIRVQGGAYGGSCRFDRFSGVFNYLSYRDPNLLGTIQNYDETAEFLRQLNLSEDELVKAIIGAIGDWDSYQLPDAKGYTSMARHLIGVTEESRQRYREEILSTTATDFHAFADVLAQVSQKGRVVVLGSPEVIDEANENGWLEVTKVL